MILHSSKSAPRAWHNPHSGHHKSAMCPENAPSSPADIGIFAMIGINRHFQNHRIRGIGDVKIDRYLL
ncbi:hypothetical protein [Iodidimonas nitroreducens]|uniref:hypothetical protein n=1 Tax=Iodidimonas nitroreducens TaxID=1236968 RepID=UPI0012311DBE|nr:hypothetical protein [Iodidimonas nitroreducens]